MSNLRNFLVDNGTVLTDHHTPLISHTSVDILTTLTGVRLGRKTFAISTDALTGDDATYTKLEAKLTELTNTRNKIAQKMIDMLEGAAFDNKSIDKRQAELLVSEAELLVASVH